MDKNTDKKINDKSSIKIWNDSEVKLLKKWGEISASYRLLHDRAFREFQVKSYSLTIPVIIMSTLSGTASFSIQSFPANLQLYVPMVIGGINIFVGIIQTVTQFLRINELTESHRVASISYGKFARNIITELSLPPNERTYNGIDFVQMCRTEMDRLIEQSPVIQMHLLNSFLNNKDFITITKPDVLSISNIVEYEPSKEEKVVELMATVADKIKTIHNNEKTHVQKIQEQIEKKVNPNKKEDIMSYNLKEVINDININDIDKNIDDITNKIINKRNQELKDIDSNNIVSRMLKKGLNGILPLTSPDSNQVMSNLRLPHLVENIIKPGNNIKINDPKKESIENIEIITQESKSDASDNV